MDPLDNIIWKALTTRQAQFAESFGTARRFVNEVGPLAAFEQCGDEGYESLGNLVNDKETLGIFLDDAHEPRPGWEFVAGAPLLQMICENGAKRPQKMAIRKSKHSAIKTLPRWSN